MKGVAAILLSALALVSCGSSKGVEALRTIANSAPDKPTVTDKADDRVLIIFYDPTIIKKEELKRLIEAYNAEVLYDYANFSGVAIRLGKGVTLDNAIDHFASIKGVLTVTKSEKMGLMD